jgi:hypothetical protein
MMSRIRDYREWNGRRRRRRSCRYSDSISSPPLPHPPVDESSPSHRLDADSRLSTETSWPRRAGALWPHSRPRTMTANYPSTLEQRGRTMQFPARRRHVAAAPLSRRLAGFVVPRHVAARPLSRLWIGPRKLVIHRTGPLSRMVLGQPKKAFVANPLAEAS